MSAKLGYLHVETDDEFYKRLRQEFPRWIAFGYYDNALDNLAWAELQRQRKIVEVYP